MVFVALPVARPVSPPSARPALLAAVLAALSLAGCSGQGAPDAQGADGGAAGMMTIVGLVQDEGFAPIPGAQVSVRLTNHTSMTDAGGMFTFTGLPLSPYLVDVAADGFLNATLNAAPQQNVSLSFILLPPLPPVPEPVTVQYTGYFQCAFEALIIPGSCDIVLDRVNQSVLDDQSSFQAGLGAGWSTAVVDVDFEPQPGIDGLRVTLRAKSDVDQLGTYEEYGKFHGPESFSFRVEPGMVLPEGDRPMPGNATGLQLDVYPHGHGWHALCTDPVPDVLPPDSCPLGVGVAQNVRFDLYVTVFFVEPAPEGFTLLA